MEKKTHQLMLERCRVSGWIPGSGRTPGGGNGNPLQDSCLESLMAREGYSPQGHKESGTTEAT